MAMQTLTDICNIPMVCHVLYRISLLKSHLQRSSMFCSYGKASGRAGKLVVFQCWHSLQIPRPKTSYSSILIPLNHVQVLCYFSVHIIVARRASLKISTVIDHDTSVKVKQGIPRVDIIIIMRTGNVDGAG